MSKKKVKRKSLPKKAVPPQKDDMIPLLVIISLLAMSAMFLFLSME